MKFLFLIPVLFLICASCQKQPKDDMSIPSLKKIFHDTFMVGAALNTQQINGPDDRALILVKQQYNTITAENCMKWEKIHPEPGKYDFGPADDFVTFGEQNQMFIVGHTLVWENQTPDWVFQNDAGDSASREELLARMKDHIQTVVGHFKGKVKGWDVVNEAFDEEGNYRKSRWMKIIGKDYIEKAFQWANEADPDAELYYNDYNMWYTGKRDAVIKMVQDFEARNISIHGIGLQGHWGMDYPPLEKLDAALKVYAETGLKSMVTEMDINVLPLPGDITGADVTQNFKLQKELNPYENGLPDSMQAELAQRYSDIFKVLIKYENSVSRVTFWGVQDGDSWMNYWPVRGRTNYPLLFDRNFQPKPAFFEVINLGKSNQ